MKTVFNNPMVAHVWAQQNQPSGRSNNGQFYFRDSTIFSYRENWPLASFATINGARRVLINVDSYSVSTSRHLSLVHRALYGLVSKRDTINVSREGLRRFIDARGDDAKQSALAWIVAERVAKWREYVAEMDTPAKRYSSKPNPLDASPPENWRDAMRAREVYAQNHYVNDVQCLAETLGVEHDSNVVGDVCARIRVAFESYYTPVKVAELTRAKDRRDKANCVARVDRFLLKGWNDNNELEAALAALIRHKSPDIWRAKLDTLRRRLATIEARQAFNVKHPDASRVVLERQAAQWRHDKPVTLPEWLTGKGAAAQYGFSTTHVRRKGDTLETSRGANAPFAHAVAIYKLAAQCRAESRTYQRNGRPIHAGHFALDSIDTQGNIKIGCHTILFDEMTRLACHEIPRDVTPCFPLPTIVK